jgi:hypothetical protein|tara:strand:+ start:2718 stop:2828 length:111 start_codon:yes stop_codon:yes gene_type:complete
MFYGVENTWNLYAFKTFMTDFGKKPPSLNIYTGKVI